MKPAGATCNTQHDPTMKHLLILIAALAFGFTAAAQVTPTITGTFTNVPTTMPATTASNVNSEITIPTSGGLALAPLIGATNAATANMGFYFQLTADGTNWSTTFPLNQQVALNGTTGQRGWTNVPQSLLVGARKIRLAYVTNGHSAPAFITNVTYSFSR